MRVTSSLSTALLCGIMCSGISPTRTLVAQRALWLAGPQTASSTYDDVPHSPKSTFPAIRKEIADSNREKVLSAKGTSGDQGNGTYINPVMPGDFSDLDVISVGADFYAISSTMQYSPGIVLLHSKDLVHWSILGHAVPDLTALDPELGWNRMNRQGRGIWAGALRYHAGEFWIYFGTPDQGIYMTRAKDLRGPWSLPKLVLAEPGWDDPCPFWDDDGEAYLVATHFAAEGPASTRYNIHLFKMRPGGDSLFEGEDKIIHQSKGSEANKLYKFHGTYYHFFSEVRAEGRVPMIERAENLNGPWEMHQLMHVHPATDKEPNQGGLIQVSSGHWYFVTHLGRGDWDGREGVLLPVTWIDGWPIPGAVGPDQIGTMAWEGEMPLSSVKEPTLNLSDEFDGPTLNPAWEWRYQPRSDGWSLTKHKGFLRLQALPSLRAGDFHSVPDVLTQRSYRSKRSRVTVRLNVIGNGRRSGGRFGPLREGIL